MDDCVAGPQNELFQRLGMRDRVKGNNSRL